jgi:hypothetical protein
MSKFRPRQKASHLEVRQIETTLPFDGLKEAAERCLASQPGLGLFADPGERVLRFGGLALRGDILIRREQLGCDGRLLLASRRGDRTVVEALTRAMGPVMRETEGEPSPAQGLTLLNFLQSDLILECARYVEVAGRALEDAFTCRFVELDELRMRLADLNGEAMQGGNVIRMIHCDEGMSHGEIAAGVPHVILHRGRRLFLNRTERVETPRGRLAVHFTMVPENRLCVVGSISETAC